MKSLVTGSNGFIGSHLVEQLIKLGHQVICFVRKTSNLRWIQNLPVQFAYGDITDIDSLVSSAKDVDYVFHVGGTVRASTADGFYRANYRGTVNLLKVCRQENPNLKKFVFVSSQAAVGPSHNRTPLKETDPPHPISIYGKSKLKAEQAVLNYQQYFPITIIRPSSVYGPRDDDILEIFKYVKFGIKPLLGMKDKFMSLIHVDDLIDGIILSCTNENSTGQIYFLANDEIYSILEIETEIERAMNKKAITIRIPEIIIDIYANVNELIAKLTKQAAIVNKDKALEMKQPFWIVNCTKARAELGFSTKISLTDGIQQTLEWYRQYGWV